MKKIKILFPIFLGIILMFSLFFIPFVNATISYYNHIQNPSFLSYSDYIEDGGFESNSLESGVVFGNWTGSDNSGISINQAHTGIYSGYTNYAVDETDRLTYILNSDYYFLGSDLESLYFWVFSQAPSDDLIMEIGYTDLSVDSDIYTVIPQQSWISLDVFSDFDVIDEMKVICNFTFIASGASVVMYLDDVVLLVDDGGGQDDITDSSTPWFHGTTPPLISPHIYGYIGINSTFGRLDNSSGYIGHLDSLGTIEQNVDLLDTDYMHFFDLYYYVDICNDIEIEITIVYSDGSYDRKAEDLTVNATWTYLNYGISFIDSDKYITKITIGLMSYTSEIVYLDDIGLWASVPITYRRFVYAISPYPIMKTTSMFNVYMGIQYTMYCYLYNATGHLSESGNYTIIDLTGSISDSFTDGTFNYVLTARNYKTDFQEYISISIVTGDEVLIFQILAIWNYVPVDIVTPITPTQTTDFMFLFIFIVIPSMFLAVILKPVGIPIIGFLSGLTIMTSIGRAVGIIDLWFLFVMVLVCVLIILAMMKRGIYT